ncbi:MAG: hypothetical protein ACR2QR_09515 [Woeseiaceae bacterium]
MKPAKFDWAYLFRYSMRPGISLAVAVVLASVSFWFYGKQASLYDVYSSNQEAIHEDYDALVYRRRLVEQYYNRYREFQDLGFVGRESRLDWIETIRLAAEGLDLPNVSYSLEPQLEVIRPVETASPDAEIQIYLSKLELELGLVHELDLLRFFARLEQEAPGLMKVDQCSIARQQGSELKLVAETNLMARCSLMMFSVVTSDIVVAGVDI